MKDDLLPRRQLGVTLIELVVVIIILGIITIVVAPKFINLKNNTRAAVLKNISGSLQSSHDLVYMKSLVQGVENELDGTTNLSSGTIDVHYGHARTHWSITWQKILNIEAEGKANGSKIETCNSIQEFCAVYNVRHGTVGYNSDWTLYIIPNGYAVNDNCYARYTLDVLTKKTYLIEFKTITSGC